MATLLTSVSTPFGSESCTSCSSGGSAEVPLCEALTEGRRGSGRRAMGFRVWNQQSTVAPELGGPFRHALPRLPRLGRGGESASLATVCEPHAVGALLRRDFGRLRSMPYAPRDSANSQVLFVNNLRKERCGPALVSVGAGLRKLISPVHRGLRNCLRERYRKSRIELFRQLNDAFGIRLLCELLRDLFPGSFEMTVLRHCKHIPLRYPKSA